MRISRVEKFGWESARFRDTNKSIIPFVQKLDGDRDYYFFSKVKLPIETIGILHKSKVTITMSRVEKFVRRIGSISRYKINNSFAKARYGLLFPSFFLFQKWDCTHRDGELKQGHDDDAEGWKIWAEGRSVCDRGAVTGICDRLLCSGRYALFSVHLERQQGGSGSVVSI